MSEMMREPDRNPEVDPTRVEEEPQESCSSLLDRLEGDFNTEEIVNELFMIYRADAPMCQWLRTANDLLNGRTPLEAIESGDYQAVLDAVNSLGNQEAPAE